MRRVLPLFLLACTSTPGASDTDISAQDTAVQDTVAQDTGTQDTAPEEPVPEEPDWWEVAGDADADGYTTEDGDCDDGQASVHPGVPTDACDGLDNDCDGDIDEDAVVVESDPYLGDLTDTDFAFGDGFLFPEGDRDIYTFEITDGWFDNFHIQVFIYQVDADVDVTLQLTHLGASGVPADGVVATVDATGLGGWEELNYEGGDFGSDSSGTYTLEVIANQGAACRTPYVLQIGGGWF